MPALGFLPRNAAKFAAVGVIAALYGLVRLPEPSSAERASLAARFRFARFPLPTLAPSGRTRRGVNPALERISAWISSVGAAVALNDLDGDGLPNDVCCVDPRTDEAIVSPAPSTPARYKPFALYHAPLSYDAATMAPMGCLPGDFNEDGRTDILVYYWGRTPILFLRGDSTPPGKIAALTRELYTPVEVCPAMERWYTNAATAADLDGDGHVDLVFGNYFPDGARVLDIHADDEERMQRSMSRAFNGGSKRFLLWSGSTTGARPSVRFSEADPRLPPEVVHGWTLALGAADLDGDLLPELYIANDFGPDRLLHNRSTPGRLRFTLLEGRRTLTTPGSKALGRDSFKGMGVDFGDLNGDGRLDILVSNINAPFALEESNFAFIRTGGDQQMRDGIAPFEDRSESLGLSRSGWCWDARIADFDNDGVPEVLQAVGFVRGTVNRWPELHEVAMGNDELLSRPAAWHDFGPGDDISGHQRNPFYVRARDGRYYDLAREIGLDESHVSRGIATADVDGDGRLDIAVANQWETSYLYRNDSPSPGAFLGLHLRLPLRPEDAPRTLEQAGHPRNAFYGRPAIGARAVARLPDGRRLVAQVDGGNGHSGKRSPDLMFGLGRVPPDARIEVHLDWRDPGGRPRRETRILAPGWHTLLLAWPAEPLDR